MKALQQPIDAWGNWIRVLHGVCSSLKDALSWDGRFLLPFHHMIRKSQDQNQQHFI